jgi:hypothetical protein
MATRHNPDRPRRRPAGGRSRHGQAPATAEITAADRTVMRARLAAMAAPREGDSPRVAALRAILRDEALMAHVIANVEQWPPLSDEQRDLLAALLHRPVSPPQQRAA